MEEAVGAVTMELMQTEKSDGVIGVEAVRLSQGWRVDTEGRKYKVE